MYLSDRTSEAIDVLVGMAFNLNRSFDRAVSFMNNKWCMSQASEIIHKNLAHLFPLLGDKLTEFKDSYNMSSVYPATHEDKREYENLYVMMQTLLDEVDDFYEGIKMAYSVANEENDFNACAMLTDFMNKFTKVIGQVITLRDKAEQMPNDYDSYDRHITSWGINGLDL